MKKQQEKSHEEAAILNKEAGQKKPLRVGANITDIRELDDCYFIKVKIKKHFLKNEENYLKLKQLVERLHVGHCVIEQRGIE